MYIRVDGTADGAARDAARSIGHQIKAAASRRGVAHIAVSGGRTPARMFGSMAELDLPWSVLHVWQVDERVAPAGDPARNVGLLDVLPVPDGHIHPMPVEQDDLRKAIWKFKPKLPGVFDVIHLGLGADGHTASWPPDDPVVDTPSTMGISREYLGHVRLTLTPRVINAARMRVVLVTGADKASVVRRWIERDPSLPISRVRRSDTLAIVDEAAATELAGVASVHRGAS